MNWWVVQRCVTEGGETAELGLGRQLGHWWHLLGPGDGNVPCFMRFMRFISNQESISSDCDFPSDNLSAWNRIGVKDLQVTSSMAMRIKYRPKYILDVQCGSQVLCCHQLLGPQQT